MALDEVTLFNRALIALGEDVIVSPIDNSKPGRLCKAAYPTVRDAVTRRVPWNCLRRRIRLAADPTPPEFEWENRYTLPADFIRMVDEPTIDGAAWVIEGDRLLSNDGPPFDLLYIGRLDNVTLADPLLADAIALSLAAEVGRALTQDEAAVNRCAQAAERKIRAAGAASAQENSVREWDVDTWLRARF